MSDLRGALARPLAPRSAIGSGWVAIAAIVLLAPLVAVTLLLHHLVLASSFASSAAVALHHPRRYSAQQFVVVRWYLLAIAVSVAGSAQGSALHAPWVLTAATCAVIVLVSPGGRTHAPTVCVPFAVPFDHNGFSPISWLYVAVAAVYLLLALAALTCKPWSRRDGESHVSVS